MDLKNKMIKSNILIKDFNYILDSELDIDKFRNRHFFITGATGLIGSLLIKFLIYANKKRNLGVEIYALIRNPIKADKIYKNVDRTNLHFVIAHLGENDLKCEAHIDYLIHLAAVTQSKLMITQPVETIQTSVNGTEEILKFAVDKHIKSMVYVSSMEVYGKINTSNKVNECDLGYVDLASVRSCYPESKRMSELLCVAYSNEFDLRVSIARLAQTFGAGILPTENRVFAQFAKSIIDNKDIILHTDGKSEGNYVYTADAIKGLLCLLLNGQKAEAYNISNEENHMTIAQMAHLVATNFGNKKNKVKIEIPNVNMGYAPEVHMLLDNSKMKNLGWIPRYNMIESYRRMIDWINSDYQ